MVWHCTQCCVLAGMGEMAALQWHHHQSQSTFWTPHTMPPFGKTCQRHQTDRACKNTPATIHTWLPLKDEGWVHGLTLTTVDETRHHTHFHTTHQSKPTLFLSLSTFTQHTLAWGHITIVPTFLFGCRVSLHTDRSPRNMIVNKNRFSHFSQPKNLFELWVSFFYPQHFFLPSKNEAFLFAFLCSSCALYSHCTWGYIYSQ